MRGVVTQSTNGFGLTVIGKNLENLIDLMEPHSEQL